MKVSFIKTQSLLLFRDRYSEAVIKRQTRNKLRVVILEDFHVHDTESIIVANFTHKPPLEDADNKKKNY